jgi:hypothetical protein
MTITAEETGEMAEAAKAIEELIIDSGLATIDDIFKAFIDTPRVDKFLSSPRIVSFAGLNGKFHTIFDHHNCPYRATMFTTSELDDDEKTKTELHIKLPNDGHVYRRLTAKLDQENIDRHKHKTWMIPKDHYLRALPTITSFIQDLVGPTPWVTFYYTQQDSRIDVFGSNKKGHTVIVTFEPGYPDWTEIKRRQNEHR